MLSKYALLAPKTPVPYPLQNFDLANKVAEWLITRGGI